MSHRCGEPIELAALVALPADDPRRLEAAACPRCDSLLRAMDTFLEGDSSVPADEMERARKALAAAMPGRRHAAPGRRASRRAVPRWGWGVGLAAVVATIAILGSHDVLQSSRPSGVLRGGAVAPTLEVAVHWAAAPGDAHVRLAWPAVEGAQRYEVELYSAALDTIGTFAAAGDPSVTVDRSAFGPTGPAGALCRVRVIDTGGAARVSRLAPLVAP